MYNSLWAETTKLPEFPEMNGDMTSDVLIIGAGLAGLLCANRLTREGRSCIVIEAGRVCQGITGNTTAKITSQHGLIYSRLIREFDEKTARLYWEANELAISEYEKMTSTIDCDFVRTSNYIYSLGSRKKLEEELAVLKTLEIPAEFVMDLPLPIKTVGAVCFQNQAQFDPMKFVKGLLSGLKVYEHTIARSIEGNTVITNRGKIKANKIIVATHFPILNKHGGYFLKMYQQRSYVLALEDAENVDGMYLAAEENGYSFRRYKDLLLLGGGGHRTGKKGGGWKQLERFAEANYPKAKVQYRWATQDCITLDGIPYIGQYSPQTPDLFVATGFNKWGMTSSMVSSIILSDLLQKRPNPYASVFAPDRTMLRKQLVVNVTESVCNLLMPRVPRCPHMGCALKWNPAERSWDCSCHGSRFSEDGTCLNTPAIKDLGEHNQ